MKKIEKLNKLYQHCFYEEPCSVTELRAHGSDRQIYRLHGLKRNVVGIVNADHAENAAFIEFSQHFKKCGLPVPEIYGDDPEQGIYLEEDLGDSTLFSFLTKQRNRSEETFPEKAGKIYEKVVELLPKFQIEGNKELNYNVCYPRSHFDEQSMRWDLNYFKYYFLKLAQIPFHEQALENDFNRLVTFLLEAKQDYFLYRDFQSRNIMVRDGEPWFIDYQGGRRGALQYDIASLLFDAKADIPQEIRDSLLVKYLDAVSQLTVVDREQFQNYYYGYVLIRMMQAMGAFGFRGFYERKSHFLQSVPFALKNLEFVINRKKLPIELPCLMDIWQGIVNSTFLKQLGHEKTLFRIHMQSFSYRKGLPKDESRHGGGFIFDCRSLPNPGRLEKYAKLTGNDSDVISFLEKETTVQSFLTHVRSLVDQAVENYQQRNFTSLTICFGCTGGQHRSVYSTNMIATHLRKKYEVEVDVTHRELEKFIK